MRTPTKLFIILGSMSAVAAAALLPALPAGAAVTEATISNFSFSPEPVRIPVGTTLHWTNQDSSAHTVTADDGSWSSPSLNSQATFSHTFSQPGTVAYHCAIHPSMEGNVVVEAATPTTAAPSTTTTAPTTTTSQASPTSTGPAVTPTTTGTGGDTTSPTTAGSAAPRASSPKPAASSTTRATAAPTTATTAAPATTTEPPASTTAPPPAVGPEDTTATTEAALDVNPAGNGSSGAGPITLGAATVLLLAGGTAWWALRRRSATL